MFCEAFGCIMQKFYACEEKVCNSFTINNQIIIIVGFLLTILISIQLTKLLTKPKFKYQSAVENLSYKKNLFSYEHINQENKDEYRKKQNNIMKNYVNNLKNAQKSTNIIEKQNKIVENQSSINYSKKSISQEQIKHSIKQQTKDEIREQFNKIIQKLNNEIDNYKSNEKYKQIIEQDSIKSRQIEELSERIIHQKNISLKHKEIYENHLKEIEFKASELDKKKSELLNINRELKNQIENLINSSLVKDEEINNIKSEQNKSIVELSGQVKAEQFKKIDVELEFNNQKTVSESSISFLQDINSTLQKSQQEISESKYDQNSLMNKYEEESIENKKKIDLLTHQNSRILLELEEATSQNKSIREDLDLINKEREKQFDQIEQYEVRLLKSDNELKESVSINTQFKDHIYKLSTRIDEQCTTLDSVYQIMGYDGQNKNKPHDLIKFQNNLIKEYDFKPQTSFIEILQSLFSSKTTISRSKKKNRSNIEQFWDCSDVSIDLDQTDMQVEDIRFSNKNSFKLNIDQIKKDSEEKRKSQQSSPVKKMSYNKAFNSSPDDENDTSMNKSRSFITENTRKFTSKAINRAIADHEEQELQTARRIASKSFERIMYSRSDIITSPVKSNSNTNSNSKVERKFSDIKYVQNKNF